jgi:hypothetical protein
MVFYFSITAESDCYIDESQEIFLVIEKSSLNRLYWTHYPFSVPSTP